jgi:predicted Zn-dependent protease
MKSLRFIAPFALLIQLCAAADAPPAKELKYHEVLLKKPSSETLFDRFFGAWIDEQDVDTLEAFLAARAANNGGADLSVFASFQLRRGSEDAALETFGKAITALPQDFSLRMERAKILLRRLEFESARKDLEIVSAGTDPVLALESSKLIGKSWLREGKSEQAIKGWDKLLAANPGDEDLLEDLVESAAAEGETEQALKYLDTLIAAGSDPYKKTLRQLRRGDLLAKAGRHDDSVSAYSTTLAAAGEGSWLEREILAQIDKAFRKQDRINELKEKLVELAQANPNRLLIHRELARIEAAQGETDAAIGRFRDVLKRTPGNRELRQEFVRLLTDGEKYQEATVELQKLIELAPQDSALLLQMADLHNREGNKETTLAALEKAHTLLGVEDESASVRIAGLMFQYGLGEAGEKLLLKFAAKPNASEAPSEALAAEYARTNRKPQALAILEKIAASDNIDTVLRTAGSISALGQSATALKVLAAKEKTFNAEPRFLVAISQGALAAGKPEIAVAHAVKLVRLATLGSDLKDRITLALRAIADANQTDEWRTTLEKQAARSLAETCLLAALADSQSDFDAVSKIMGGTNDPTLVRFHAALLDRRNEFEQAITVLKSLAETPEGRKASYLKDMTDLQRRAGLTDDALATVELWKQRAPGDKTAWVTGSSILREEGRSEEAVKVTRQAVSRFEEDKDLAATLAALHEEAGQMENAEAIYWRLYDQAESPADQARWSVRLAELSMSTGRSEELEEKLRERARSNRLSIGPILAQAELARITRDENKRRDLLLEAVRLQPKDIDLRLQIANLEEQSGSPERAVAILEEAAPTDTTNNIRRALAQAYLRQGQTLKGMRELRALAGKQSDDPRNVEQSAAALAGSGLYDEAIRFLRETLPDGGDWRTRYLLAVMLEHDGRESEAIPIFQTLRQTTTEIPSLLPSATNTPQQKKPWDDSPESVREIIRIMISKQAAYSHRSQSNYQGTYNQGGTMVGPFMLPDNIKSLHSYSLVHLTKLGAEGIENNAFIKELISTESDDSPDFAAMLTKYPEHPGLLEMVLLYASSNRDRKEINPDLLRKLLASRKDLSPADRFRANFILVTSPNAPETAWDEFIAAAKPLTDLKEKNANEISGIAYQIMMLLSQEEIKIPEKSHKELSKIILGIAASQNLDSGYMQGFKLAIFCAIGTTEQWIDAANKEIDTFRKEEAHSNRSAVNPNANMYGSNRRGINNPWMNGNESPFSMPTIESVEFASLPAMIPRMIRQSSKGRSFSRTMEPSKLLAKIDTITSPLLRAWVAIRSGDKVAMDKYLQETPSDTEAADFASLRALNALEKKDFTAAYKLISGQRAALASDRNRITSLNFQLLAIAAEMSPEQRKEIAEELGQLLIQSRRTLGIQGAPILAEQAERLGLTNLAKRFLPAAATQLPRNSAQGPASFSNNQSSSSSSGNPSIDKLKKFAKEGKKEAAALEALNLIRKALLDQRNRSYEISEIREVITQDVLAEVMKLIEPGNSESLTKLTEYADICINFGKPDQALAVLNRLHTARPKDAAIAAKLAFILPATERDRAIKLISSAVNDPNFAQIAFEFGSNLSEDENNESTFKYFETTTQWLETANPDDHQKTNLTWASYLAKEFFDGDYFENRNNLSESDPAQLKNNKDFQRFAAVAKRLSLAMLRHASIAEEGFRLSRHSRAWTFTDAELDHYARSALMAGASLRDLASRNLSFFDYRSDQGSYGSGEDLAELSSVGWLTSRLATAKSPDDIFPPAYLSQLREKNTQFGEIITAIAGMKNVAELEKLWKSEALDKSSGPFAEMLREGVLILFRFQIEAM